jgi:hypothetical protein
MKDESLAFACSLILHPSYFILSSMRYPDLPRQQDVLACLAYRLCANLVANAHEQFFVFPTRHSAVGLG